MKKILINGPLLSNSGYGEMSRFALNVLKEHQDKFDIYVNVLTWGQTGWMHEETDEYTLIRNLRIKTEQYAQASGGKPQFDISLQITIPNEWKRMASSNIGYTAGIETTHISPAWLEPSQAMDKIITISNFSKSSFINTIFQDQSGKEHRVTTPIEVVHFPWTENESSPLNLELTSQFNFLTVNQWGPRKNMEMLISTFIDEFRNEDVGLVIKTNQANDSQMDRDRVETALKGIIASKGEKKCRVHLVHGRLTESEMRGLYRHPNIKAFVTSTHGEGFGMPIYEATQAKLPVIATDWSGHLDFLSVDDKKMFAKVDFDVKQIEPQHVWQGVMEANSGWAFPTVASLRTRMREVYKDYGRFKSWANKLAEHNKEKFNKQKVYNHFFNALNTDNNIDNSITFLEDVKEEVNPVSKISFCISTNAKKIEKTLKSINSIKNTMNGVSCDYEIVVCGVTDPFSSVDSIKLIQAEEDANSGMLAKLRNIAADNCSGDAIVFLDDDIIFDKDWADKFIKHSNNNHWDVLGNKILLPDGGRYWDRAILNPHQMVSYDFVDTDPRLYQTGCFWIVRKEVFDKYKWDSTIEYYAQKNGKMNEDVEYSQRLKQAGYKLKFDQSNLVWHWDDSYQEVEINPLTSLCLKKDMIPANMLKQTQYKKEFESLLQEL